MQVTQYLRKPPALLIGTLLILSTAIIFPSRAEITANSHSFIFRDWAGKSIPVYDTVPNLDKADPHGLKDTNLSRQALGLIFSRHFIVLLGDQDTEPLHPSLNRGKLTFLQGPHRFARGHHFYSQAVMTSTQLSLPLNASLVLVPGVGHNNKGLARIAAPLLLNGPINIYD